LQFIANALSLTPPLLVAIYTINYGRWAWQRQYKAGAIGLFILAALTVAVPGFILLRPQ
jgi:hypothetical protein